MCVYTTRWLSYIYDNVMGISPQPINTKEIHHNDGKQRFLTQMGGKNKIIDPAPAKGNKNLYILNFGWRWSLKVKDRITTIYLNDTEYNMKTAKENDKMNFWIGNILKETPVFWRMGVYSKATVFLKEQPFSRGVVEGYIVVPKRCTRTRWKIILRNEMQDFRMYPIAAIWD